MFNFFKKKEKLIDTTPKDPKRIIYIEFKNGKALSYETRSRNFPYHYRKLINWFYARKSQMYTLQYKNGQVIFNRDDILIINITKEE